MTQNASQVVRYGWFVLFVAGLGGLLFGVDVGIIAAALLYLGKTIDLTVSQTSYIVAAVLGGGMVSSLVAGAFADWFGRKRMMVVSGLIFVASVGMIILSRGFVMLFVGRLLQGMSGGVTAVVVPLYLAECLSPGKRGRGTAIFQFMLTFGIVIAALIGLFYTRQAENAIAEAVGNPILIRTAEDHAWRGMFLTVMYPGVVFFLGSLALSETPRWLFWHGRMDEARTALRRASSEEQVEIEMREMEELAAQNHRQAACQAHDLLLQRKYMFPFLLACAILAINQATGINSILGFLVVILKYSGMTAQYATEGDVAVKVINCAMTVLAIGLVDKKGRKFLLKIGTGGIVIALGLAALVFYRFESQRVNVKGKVDVAIQGNAVTMPIDRLGPVVAGHPMALTVLYSYGSGQKVASVLSNDQVAELKIEPEKREVNRPLTIKSALYGPVPSETTGWLIAACLGLFAAAYSVGPGVVVWLALSELMPTRIRSMGMGIAVLLNQGVSTVIAAAFLSVVGHYGYYAMFAFWAVSSAVYFLIATFLLPETKGKTLEEIENYFEEAKRAPWA